MEDREKEDKKHLRENGLKMKAGKINGRKNGIIK